MITVSGLAVLTVALLLGRKIDFKQNTTAPSATIRSQHAALLESQFSAYISRKLKLQENVPEGMAAVSGQLAVLDGRVSGLAGRVHSIRRYMHEADDDVEGDLF